jgi:thymidylate synthase
VTTLVLPDARNGYVQLVSWLIETGAPVDGSRGGGTLERTGVTIEMHDPTGVMLPLGVNRKVNTKLAAVETLQLLSGTGSAELLRRAAPTYGDVMVQPEHIEYGAYGLRVRHQLDQVYRELLDNPASRRAVLAIWREDDLFHDGDRPCTLSLNFIIRDGKLELHVMMRSQDVWLGVPYDLFMFTQIQLSLARQLGVPAGKYVHHATSLHIYRRDLNAAGMLTTVAADHPRPADYPTGVVAIADDETFTDVATYLLEGSANQDEVDANAWYARTLVGLLSAPTEAIQ